MQKKDSVETAYAEAEVHILRLEGALRFFDRFRQRLQVNISGVPPGPLMRMRCYRGLAEELYIYNRRPLSIQLY